MKKFILFTASILLLVSCTNSNEDKKQFSVYSNNLTTQVINSDHEVYQTDNYKSAVYNAKGQDGIVSVVDNTTGDRVYYINNFKK